MKTTFIYALKDPISFEIRYVGKSNNPKSRFNKHIGEARRNPNNHRLCWIKGLLDNNLKPILEILEEIEFNKWQEREIFYISTLPNLTNTLPGGEYSPMSEQRHIDKMKETKRLNPQIFTEKTKKLLSEIRKNEWNTGIRKGGKPCSQSRKDKMIIKSKLMHQNRTPEQQALITEKIKLGKSKILYQYSKDLQLIKIWPSRKEARKNSYNEVRVNEAIKNKLIYKDSIWSFTLLEASDPLVVNQKFN